MEICVLFSHTAHTIDYHGGLSIITFFSLFKTTQWGWSFWTTMIWPVSGQQNTSATESSSSSPLLRDTSLWACLQVSTAHTNCAGLPALVIKLFLQLSQYEAECLLMCAISLREHSVWLLPEVNWILQKWRYFIQICENLQHGWIRRWVVDWLIKLSAFLSLLDFTQLQN